jgi:hypothetical protein
VYRAVGGEDNPSSTHPGEWHVCKAYTLEGAKEALANTSVASGAEGGRVPMGEQTWKRWDDSGWKDHSITITALAAAEMEGVTRAVVKAAAAAAATAEAAVKVAAQKQAALTQAEEV